MNIFVFVLEKSEVLLHKIRKSILRITDDHFRVCEKWYKDDPHDLMKHSFSHLGEHSIVFDLGGYEGQWSSDLYARYLCHLYIFEPVSSFALLIRARFSNNQKIKVFNFGLAEKSRNVRIIVDKFSSRVSEEKNGNLNTEQITLKSFNEFIQEHNISKIDLIKINIEGSEFSLLEELIRSGTVKLINSFLIQFHKFGSNAVPRRKSIQEELSKTHIKVFDYPFVWECWKLKS